MSAPRSQECGEHIIESENRETDQLQKGTINKNLEKIIESRGSKCLKFSSADGGHYIRFEPEGGLKAVYAGPHGPENRPAMINQENIERLATLSDCITVVDIEDSPYSDVALVGSK